MTKLGIAPCYDSCPIHGNPSGYVALTAAGNFEQAYESATAANPFPSICGRICEHPCEQSCNRKNLDSPVSIAYIKRFVADWHHEHGTKLTPQEKQASIEENGRKVAIIGSGPAGLSAALELRKTGYSPTVFEKHGVLGGMMRIGIPEYRLPIDIIEQGFEAVFLSMGSHKSMKMGIDGEDLNGASNGIDFLRNVRLGNKTEVKENVTLIGGGNVAMDCARSLRLHPPQ